MKANEYKICENCLFFEEIKLTNECVRAEATRSCNLAYIPHTHTLTYRPLVGPDDQHSSLACALHKQTFICFNKNTKAKQVGPVCVCV